MEIDQENIRIKQVFFLYNAWVNALHADPVSTSILDKISMLGNPDRKVYGANMGPIWGRQDPGGPMLVPWTLLSGNPQPSVNHNTENDF